MPGLHTILADLPFEYLPPSWTTFDLAPFSPSKTLWNYQQSALQNALKALWKYYEEYGDFAPIEPDSANLSRKERLIRWYADNRIQLDPDLYLGRKRRNTSLLSPYYPIYDSRIPYQYFINRMGFWMATGSGKTLVIVKLLELLWTLMQRGEIPAHDVMVLTHREDLLQQLHDHVYDYNTAGRIPHLHLRELREYPEVKRGFSSLFHHQEMTVFYYRSDNLSDEQKERIIDFRNYDNDGKWYILLDEAHKGDKEDSKRQHIYSILSRNGFLFNFSATFTDPRDIRTTAFEFNLASFIQNGWGKHISLLKQENRAFRDKEDFTNEEKQRIVLQSLLMLTYVARSRENLCKSAKANLYHRPLLLALVNSVNTKEADLKLFFRELERIGKGQISPQAFAAAKSALKAELDSPPEWLYEKNTYPFDQALFNRLTMNDVFKYVFNSESKGDIEVLVRPSNNKELAFSLKTSAAPFALIKIGQTTEWLKDFLAGYEIVKGFEDESFFARLNEESSEINLLMGSRSFYEGWDSNRPNVITFINIGTGADARKFILQSVGRGVRIEPMKGKRRRLEPLHNAGEVDDLLFSKAKLFLAAVQTLFIFGTKRDALATIFEGLDKEREKEEGTEVALDVNHEALGSHPLLIPVYHGLPDRLLIEGREPRKFEIQDSERQLLSNYVGYLGDQRLLLARHGMMPRQINLLQKTLSDPATYFNPSTTRLYGTVEIILPRLTQYFGLIQREVAGFKPLEDEINHFKHIRVLLKDVTELQQKIKAVRFYKDSEVQKDQLKHRLREGKIDIDEYTSAILELAQPRPAEIFDYHGQRLHIKHIAKHYYLPLLLSDDEKIDFIYHVIRVPSEIRFINQIEAYLKEPDNLFKRYDWWLFSRTDESLDKVVLPYYDPTQNRIRDFHPDFVFWLVKGNDYTVLFVDPKGMTISGYQYKIDGYKELFRDDTTGCRNFTHHGYRVRVSLAMYTADANQAPQEYKDYWYDNPKAILQKLAQ